MNSTEEYEFCGPLDVVFQVRIALVRWTSLSVVAFPQRQQRSAHLTGSASGDSPDGELRARRKPKLPLWSAPPESNQTATVGGVSAVPWTFLSEIPQLATNDGASHDGQECPSYGRFPPQHQRYA